MTLTRTYSHPVPLRSEHSSLESALDAVWRDVERGGHSPAEVELHDSAGALLLFLDADDLAGIECRADLDGIVGGAS